MFNLVLVLAIAAAEVGRAKEEADGTIGAKAEHGWLARLARRTGRVEKVCFSIMFLSCSC